MKKFAILITALLVFSAILLSACGSADTTAKLAGTSWKLVSYGPKDAQIPAADGIDTRMDFGTDGNVSGSMGCNRFSGPYSQKGDSITFSAIAATEMACPEPQMTQESNAFQVLVGSVKIEQSGTSLTIFSADGTSKLVLAKIEAGL
ncbi:MAG: META domain-containing protein [Anaerolineaceae bacterium]|nr:META domain-containing protein [Anaerolineaceae bacterium]